MKPDQKVSGNKKGLFGKLNSFSISQQASVAFLFIMLLAVSDVLFSQFLFHRSADTAGIVNQAGKLRYISQKIAFHAIGLTHGSEESRRVISALIPEYEHNFSSLEQEINITRATLLPPPPELHEKLRILRTAWEGGYRQAAQNLVNYPMGSVEAGSSYLHIHDNADKMLQLSDEVVEDVVSMASEAHAKADVAIYLMLLAEAFFLLLAFWYIKRRIVSPLRQLSHVARNFSQGDYTLRVNFESRNELGQFVQDFNQSADKLEKLIAEQSRLIAIIEATPDYVGISDTAGLRSYTNRSGRKMVGISSEEDVSSQTIADLHPAWAFSIIKETGIPCAIRDGAWIGETALLTRDGHEIPVSQLILSHKNGNGIVTHLSTIMRDISNLKQNAEHYHKLFEEATDAIAIADANTGELIDLNRSMEQLVRWEKSELIGKPQKVLHPPEPERAIVSGSFEQHRSSNEGGLIETQIITKNGEIRDVEIKASSMVFNGRRTLIGFFRDITERKAAARALQVQKQFVRQVIDTDPSRIHVKDANGTFLLVNQALADAFGLSPEEIVGRKINEINPYVTEVESYLRVDREVIQTRREIRTIERSSMGGQERWFLSIKRPIELPDGTVNALGISVDITEQRHAENELKNMAELLEQRVAALTESEARLAQAQAQAHLGNWSLDMLHKEVRWSDEVYRIFGLDTHTVLNRDIFLACVHPADRERVKETVDAIISTCDAQYGMDYRIVLTDGTQRFVHEEAKTVCDETGKVVSIFGTAQDITERKKYEESLFNTNELMERIFANLHTHVAYLDRNFNFIRVNQAYADADGHPPEYYVGKNHFELFPNEENEAIFREVVASGKSYTAFAKPFVYEHNQERGVTYWDWVVQPVHDAEGRVAGLVLSLLNVTAQKLAEGQLRLWGRALDASVNSIVIVDATQKKLPIIYTNPAFTRITGYSLDDVLGKNPKLLQRDDRDQPEIENLRQAVRESREGHAILRNYKKDGTLFWNDVRVAPVRNDLGCVTNFIGVSTDITERKRYELELEYLATHDVLTGLPNRSLLQDRLSQAINHARRNSKKLAVIFFDLDEFKVVNDSLGHHIGDQLLKAVVKRLVSCLREEDTVARQGGDEFVIVLDEITKDEDVTAIIEKLQHALSLPINLDEKNFFTSACMGIALYPRDGETEESLLRNADTAMYRAKERGNNCFQFYAPEMNTVAVDRLRLENGLRRALDQNELVIHYQPQVNLRSGHITGIEALLRWQHPELGLIAPLQFISVAEDTGLIVPIGEWVLQTACSQAKRWVDQGSGITIAVNLSTRQFKGADIVKTVKEALDSSGLESQYLELELTESILIQQPEEVFACLRKLKEMGVRLSIDDFGTGYSSLSYLSRFPVDKLKIDKSFMPDVISDPHNAAILCAIISMAHNLKLQVIAEGVESKEQLFFLRDRKCDEVQGYYFSRPLPADEISAMLSSKRQLELASAAVNEAPALLLVDDEENILNSLVRALRRDGYRILKTTSAKEALMLLATNQVGVIVSDQLMPEMSGVEFLRRVKELHPESVRMVLSGYTDLRTVTDAINKGEIYKFLTKPWEEDLLRANISEAFMRYEMKQENNRMSEEIAVANEELNRAKHMLEKRVDEKTLEALRNMDILKISQEVLECLPIGVIGVDGDGMIAVANQKAKQVFGAVVGSFASECMPPDLQGCLKDTMEGKGGKAHAWQIPQGGEVNCWCHSLGAASQAQGSILVLVPKEMGEA